MRNPKRNNVTMKANGVNTPFFYCMIIQRPDFCDPSRRIMLSSCILLRCLDIALLLIFNLLAISREVILAFSDISCRMDSRVSGPPFWSTFLVFGPPFCSPFSSSNAKSSSIDFLYCGKQGNTRGAKGYHCQLSRS